LWCACLCVGFLVLRLIRAQIYDVAVISTTAKWYKAVLDRLAPGSVVLDVGIGTGSALARNSMLVRQRTLSIHGIDYDPDYVRRCQQVLRRAGLSSSCTVRCVSVYDLPETGGYDAVYFSGSLMIMPDPKAALIKAKHMLNHKPTARIFVTQTFEKNKNPVLEMLKPLLKFITTIDFGHVSYEPVFLQQVKAAELAVEEFITLHGAFHSSSSQYKLAILKSP